MFFKKIFNLKNKEESLDRIKIDFVSIAAHQLRTPLSKTKWALDLLLENKSSFSEKDKDLIDKAYQSNERMINLVDDLICVSSIDEGVCIGAKENKKINDLINSVVADQEININEKKIKLNKDLSQSEKLIVSVDSGKIVLAVSSLLENAIKYSEKNKEILLSTFYKKEKNEVELTIKDSGIGIPLSQQKKVFNKFFRGSNVMRMETDGTGLGLFISKKIIEAHGGEIKFKSSEKDGSSFSLTLPVLVD